MAASSPIQLSPSHTGMIKTTAPPPAGSLEECNRLLQRNHEEYHMFFRDTAGHNHIVHSLLTILALGAGPQELRDRYDDGIPIQRAMPSIDTTLLDQLTANPEETLHRSLGQIAQYHTFLAFFKGAITAHGWQHVIQTYVFARTELADAMLARMYEGAYHPIIHLGLGIEFAQPSIVAEALAQAAAHDDSHIALLFQHAERAAAIQYPTARPKPLIELVHAARANESIRSAPHWTDFGNKMRDGIVGRAGEAMASLCAEFRVREHELERRTAEMVSTCAYFAGAAQRAGRKPKIDFFYMHCVTSSLFFTVFARQEWIAVADRVRLLEWKGRLDLAWYAVCGCAPLEREAISRYNNPGSEGMGWEDLFRAVSQEHDDGHAAKFIRALKNGQDVAAPFESSQEWQAYFPMRGDMWLRLARMCQDTTKDLPTDLKWVPFTGFEQPWKRPDLAE